MRTALLAWDYPPAPSGLSTAAREIAESLAAAGAEVTVFTLDRTGREQVGGVTVEGLALPPGGGLARLRLWGSAGHLAAPLAFRRAVLAAHARAPFDVIEATNWYAPAVLLARRRDLPLVTRSSTPAAFTRGTGASLRDRLDGRTADALERAQARSSAGLIANTAEHGAVIARAYRLSGRQPSAVIGLSLPPEIFSNARAAPYPETDAPVRLLFVGRAEARKGFDALLDAVAILAAEQAAGALPPFRLDLVGVPPNDLPPDLPDAARQRISARGRIDTAALAQAYVDAHAVLAPSRYESFGLVYQEAMAYGRPVVACAEDASARAFVGASGAGPLAQAATGPALADALRALLLDPGLRRAYRMRALAAAGRFDRASLGRETLALYEAAIAAARHG
ncbi:glycosyltransferase family 4 protein [Methylorubrum extorquens]|jgi:glycogen(starch) synthase|uniref:Glycosyl transferase n=3 Tax=Methylorubrum extorquens TaxID=408 RepID=C5APH1_METEA|nr:glycosyltransferase family 4 protein [Methylorubrum extorquens]ACS38056.1 putative glycosyl transferase [Methylorubrum extorquens AM1]MCP1543900.1 glycosyltransferase involved in cell wall biosynthesis [Methylorubrum extorquens]MCP1588754.1 glycosyltransferase involved in cell wall biosynthesis [Methylorubrum extorquens]